MTSLKHALTKALYREVRRAVRSTNDYREAWHSQYEHYPYEVRFHAAEVFIRSKRARHMPDLAERLAVWLQCKRLGLHCQTKFGGEPLPLP